VVQQIQDFVLTFSSILWEALPFIVLGAVVAGVLEELLPQQLLTRFLPRYVVPAVMIGGLLGLLFPMCECGIVVVMRRLLRKGLPLSCCIAYMLAGPIVNGVVILSTYAAFELHGYAWTMIGFRVGLGFLVACVTGLVVHFVEKRSGAAKLLTPLALPPAASPRPLPVVENGNGNGPRKSVWARLSNISETALHDFIDITVFLILGAVLASMAKMYITPEEIARLSREQPLLTIPAMMALAVVMCLCSEADAFVAASFTEMSFSSKLAFLVLGPMLDLKLLLMYTRVFRARLIFTIVPCVVVQVLLYTVLVHAANINPTSTLSRATTPAPVASPAK
jgi:uncharacterized membrane protein YraQ (UPF0718 family)